MPRDVLRWEAAFQPAGVQLGLAAAEVTFGVIQLCAAAYPVGALRDKKKNKPPLATAAYTYYTNYVVGTVPSTMRDYVHRDVTCGVGHAG